MIDFIVNYIKTLLLQFDIVSWEDIVDLFVKATYFFKKIQVA